MTTAEAINKVLAKTTASLSEKLERLTIDEVGKVIPVSPQKESSGEEISWSVWCEACMKEIRSDLGSTDIAQEIGEIHRYYNPSHPEKCIVVMVHVVYTEVICRV